MFSFSSIFKILSLASVSIVQLMIIELLVKMCLIFLNFFLVRILDSSIEILNCKAFFIYNLLKTSFSIVLLLTNSQIINKISPVEVKSESVGTFKCG